MYFAYMTHTYFGLFQDRAETNDQDDFNFN